ncbi:RibD family protein [Actinocorallia sp. API 0066]|uniref:RibD family protein n=1 Tax=Actinocorallia sp. API 0066 TaxID=2896846 RepID=UPI001E2E7864|nr:RibD family protein [Actinocorallia sp. API 0066]MCD0448610.1 RibD family protein [Actinocorallia sp. API 0066]
MGERPYVVVSVAVSVDGFIDDASGGRLRLSNAEDFERVDEVRAGVDAILVGAETVRRDNPSLLVRSEMRRAERRRKGVPEDLVKVTLTSSGEGLEAGARFFTTGEEPKIVYTVAGVAGRLRERLGGVAEIVDLGEWVGPRVLLEDLYRRGVRRVMVEGGGGVHTAFLTADVVDEVHLAVAPFFIGDGRAPRFTYEGVFPQGPGRPMRLAEVRAIGEIAFLRYLIGESDG